MKREEALERLRVVLLDRNVFDRRWVDFVAGNIYYEEGDIAMHLISEDFESHQFKVRNMGTFHNHQKLNQVMADGYYVVVVYLHPHPSDR